MLYFRLPFREKIFTTDENPNFSNVKFFQFNEQNFVEFNGNLIEISQEQFLKTPISLNDFSTSNLVEETQQEYLEKLQNVIDFIKENQLQKLVLSRRKLIGYNNINFQKSFLNLCENYTNAFVYLFEQNGICWMGAFSELLGKFNKKTSEFETMGLAGTLPINENWTSKEIEEQKPVSEYIQNILMNFSNSVEVSETYDHFSGNIKHLRTDFKIKIKEEKLENLISELHPTPAVCGIPKDFCRNGIQKLEKYPREFYAGFSKIETENDIQFFVNLRCAKFFKNAAHLFVGGGITKYSSPEKEWQETELKSKALLKNLVIS